MFAQFELAHLLANLASAFNLASLRGAQAKFWSLLKPIRPLLSGCFSVGSVGRNQPSRNCTNSSSLFGPQDCFSSWGGKNANSWLKSKGLQMGSFPAFTRQLNTLVSPFTQTANWRMTWWTRHVFDPLEWPMKSQHNYVITMLDDDVDKRRVMALTGAIHNCWHYQWKLAIGLNSSLSILFGCPNEKVENCCMSAEY